jgi:ADP-heptose:LPS heptosyltransferase
VQPDRAAALRAGRSVIVISIIHLQITTSDPSGGKAVNVFLARSNRAKQAGGTPGLVRFQRALEALPAGGEAHVWVRLPLQLGDLVMTLPSLFTIRRVWAELAASRGIALKLTLTGKRAVTLFQEAVPGEFAACHADEEFPASSSPLALRRHWSANRPLAIINYTKSDRLKYAAWLDRVPVRAGIGDGGGNWCYHFSHPYVRYGEPGHRLFRLLPMTRWLAGPGVEARMEALGPERFGGGSAMLELRRQGWDGGPYVVFGVNPLMATSERRWFPEPEPWRRLAALARAQGITPVLAGGPEHQPELDPLALETGSLSMAGRTTLPQLMALLANAMGTISVDTGIAHLAAATGKPTVVVFSHGDERLDLPCGRRVLALRGDPAGAPAYPHSPDSMARATVPWAVATATIPAGRAWALLNLLDREDAPAPI